MSENKDKDTETKDANPEEAAEEKKPSVRPFTVSVTQLPAGVVPYAEIHFKPYAIIYTMMAISVLMIVFNVLRALGIIMLALVLIVMIKVQDYIQFAFYQECLVIYHPGEHDTCQMIPFDQIAEWTILHHKSTGDTLYIHTKDNQDILEPAVHSSPVYQKMMKRLPKLESQELKMEKMRLEKSNSFKVFHRKKKEDTSKKD